MSNVKRRLTFGSGLLAAMVFALGMSVTSVRVAEADTSYCGESCFWHNHCFGVCDTCNTFARECEG